MTRFREYAEFHCHPQSFDSASTPEAFLAKELELGSGIITATDHGSMGALRKIYDLAKKNKIKSALGIEAYMRDDNCPILKKHGISVPKDYIKYHHITIHARDQKAFEKLSVKLSNARQEGHGSQMKPLWDWKDLEEILAENVTVGSSCLVGGFSRHLITDGLSLPERFEIASSYYDRLRGMTRPGNFYCEMFPHKCDTNWVTGIFADLADGQRVRLWERKKIKLEKLGEIEAAEAVKIFGTKRWHEGDRLVSIMNNRKWSEMEPVVLKKIEKVENFLANECTPSCPDGDVQLMCNRAVQMLADKYGDKIVISGDSHFTKPEEQIVQEVRLSALGNWKFSNSYHRQNSEESFAHFEKSLGTTEAEFSKWVDNSQEWADGFKDFKLDSEVSLPTKFYPADTLRHTKKLIDSVGRMDWSNPNYLNRLKTEIDLFHLNGKLDLLPYFFLGAEAVNVYERAGLLSGPARGSAGGTLLTYLLGITHIDPLKYDLSLDRFLTLDRINSGKLPDVDMDFQSRDLFVDPEDQSKGWFPERFGDHYCQIGTSTRLRLRSSVKDVARFKYKFVPETVERLAKKFTIPPQGIDDYDFIFGYEAAGEEVAGSIEYDKALIEYVSLYPDDWKIVQQTLGLERSRSKHASAVVIAGRPVAEFLPQQTVGGVKCTQYNMGDVEAAGGLKMDFLVVSSLSDIQMAIKMIQKRSGISIPESLVVDGKKVPGIRLVPFKGLLCDIWDLPEDQPVFHDICEGKTETVFQFSTSGATQWLSNFNHWKDKATNRKSIDSIMAMAIFTALDRPGPLDASVEGGGQKHNMLVEYARRARGEAPVGEIGLLSEILPETKGIMVFQEGLQKMYKNLTGCTGAEAEEFRSNVAKKKMDKILKARDPWMEGVGNRYGKEIAETVWNQTVTFGQYAFCVDGDQLIKTSIGPKKISNVTNQDMVATWNGDSVEFQHPSAVWNSGNKEVFNVVLDDGTSIAATLDHRFLYRGQWKTLNDLILMESIEVTTVFQKNTNNVQLRQTGLPECVVATSSPRLRSIEDRETAHIGVAKEEETGTGRVEDIGRRRSRPRDKVVDFCMERGNKVGGLEIYLPSYTRNDAAIRNQKNGGASRRSRQSSSKSEGGQALRLCRNSRACESLLDSMARESGPISRNHRFVQKRREILPRLGLDLSQEGPSRDGVWKTATSIADGSSGFVRERTDINLGSPKRKEDFRWPASLSTFQGDSFTDSLSGGLLLAGYQAAPGTLPTSFGTGPFGQDRAQDDDGRQVEIVRHFQPKDSFNDRNARKNLARFQKLSRKIVGTCSAQRNQRYFQEKHGNISRVPLRQLLGRRTGKMARTTETTISAKRIVSVTSLGIRPVWDMTMPHFSNFILENGAIAHNCQAHAVAYCHISYACAFLKHHYPLEWWTAVLSNATKNEVGETFWRYAGHLIDLPEINKSSENFEIVGNRIQAPLSLLQGIGAKAHDQIMRYRPYTDILDFCQKMEEHCIKGAKPEVDEAGQPVMVEVKGAKPKRKKGDKPSPIPEKVYRQKVRRAHNAATRKVVQNLIIAGALDSLFPKTKIIGDESFPFSDDDKLMAYEQALATATNKKIVAVDEDLRDMSEIKKYQHKRNVLAVYSEPLLPMIERATDKIIKKESGERFWAHGIGKIPFVTPERYRDLDALDPWPRDEVLWVALPVYVLAQRPFSYQNGKEACEFLLDVDGVQMKFVRWPERRGPLEGQLDPLYKEQWVGSIAVAACQKRNSERPFSLERLAQIQNPLPKKKVKDHESTED